MQIPADPCAHALTLQACNSMFCFTRSTRWHATDTSLRLQGSGMEGVSNSIIASAPNLGLWLRAAHAVQAAVVQQPAQTAQQGTASRAAQANATAQASLWAVLQVHAHLSPPLHPAGPPLFIRSLVRVALARPACCPGNVNLRGEGGAKLQMHQLLHRQKYVRRCERMLAHSTCTLYERFSIVALQADFRYLVTAVMS